MTVELVQRTLNKAIKSQDYPEAVILHSDQGSQYTSLEYEELLKYYGMTHSFSRRGYPYHNASLESWHGHLKESGCINLNIRTLKGSVAKFSKIYFSVKLRKKERGQSNESF
jgi:transposase InsO family protein